jgi:hypothetical protein
MIASVNSFATAVLFSLPKRTKSCEETQTLLTGRMAEKLFAISIPQTFNTVLCKREVESCYRRVLSQVSDFENVPATL